MNEGHFLERRQEKYLGDGLYASFDGYMVTLRAPRMNCDHWVGLEPEVFKALIAYWEEVHNQPHERP